MFFVPSPFHLPLRVIPSPSRRRASLSRSFRTDACVSDLSRPSRINAEYCLLRPTFLAARSTTRWVGEFPRCTNTYARLSLSLSILFHPRIHRRRTVSLKLCLHARIPLPVRFHPFVRSVRRGEVKKSVFHSVQLLTNSCGKWLGTLVFTGQG